MPNRKKLKELSTHGTDDLIRTFGAPSLAPGQSGGVIMNRPWTQGSGAGEMSKPVPARMMTISDGRVQGATFDRNPQPQQINQPFVDRARGQISAKTNNPYALQGHDQINADLKPYYEGMNIPEHARLAGNSREFYAQQMMAGRDPSKWTVDTDTEHLTGYSNEGGMKLRRLTNDERVQMYQDAQVTQQMGALERPERSLFDNHAAPMDSIFQTLPREQLPASLVAGYRNKTNAYTRSLGAALANHNQTFNSVEEYEDFLKSVPGGDNPMIEGHIRQMGEQMLRKVAPGLHDKLKQQQEVERINDRAKVDWYKSRLPAQEAQSMTDDDVLAAFASTPELDEEYHMDPAAPKYGIDPATGRPVMKPPEEPTQEQQFEKIMESTQRRVDRLNQIQPGQWDVDINEKGEPVPVRMSEKATPDQQFDESMGSVQHQVDRLNELQPGQWSVDINEKGQIVPARREVEEGQTTLENMGNEVFRSLTKAKRGEAVLDIYQKFQQLQQGPPDTSNMRSRQGKKETAAYQETRNGLMEAIGRDMDQYGIGLQDVFSIMGVQGPGQGQQADQGGDVLEKPYDEVAQGVKAGAQDAGAATPGTQQMPGQVDAADVDTAPLESLEPVQTPADPEPEKLERTSVETDRGKVEMPVSMKERASKSLARTWDSIKDLVSKPMTGTIGESTIITNAPHTTLFKSDTATRVILKNDTPDEIIDNMYYLDTEIRNLVKFQRELAQSSAKGHLQLSRQLEETIPELKRTAQSMRYKYKVEIGMDRVFVRNKENDMTGYVPIEVFQSNPGMFEKAEPKAQEKQTGIEAQEGATATNPKTGEKMIFRGGQWEKI